MSDVATETSGGWQRWQIALAIGLPVGVVTIVTGCIIYYWCRDDSTEDSSHDPVNSSRDPVNKLTKANAQDDTIPVTTSSR